MVFARGWCFMAIEKSIFGDLTSKEFAIGDIVEWSSWDSSIEEWKFHYGILLTIENEIRSNRLVSISRVIPLEDSNNELEFFTMSLRVVSHKEEIETI
jgi:hypothetical protein|tara:strand:- start:5826 stop:6119 length:294 start_codon:yes stop_codon:yes gene_type:complete